MKQYTSKVLKSLAITFLAFPLVHISAAAVLFDIPANLCLTILLSPSYYLVSLIAMVAGYGLWEMHRWSWYLFVIANVLISYESAFFLNSYGESHHKGLAFLATVLIQLALVYRVAREIRVPYFYPKIRWWESNPRYRLSVPVKLARLGEGEVLEAEILDLSTTGCFVKLRGDLTKDESLGIRFSVFGLPVGCNGIVVWRTQSTVTHPRGVGIKFMQVSRADKRVLRTINRKLKKLSQLYRRSRYLMNQDEFLKQMEEIEAKGSRHEVR